MSDAAAHKGSVVRRVTSGVVVSRRRVKTAVAPLLVGADLPSVVAAVDAEQRGIDLSGARLSSHGRDGLVLRTVDGWIVRFPPGEEQDVAREVAIMDRLAGRLTAATPEGAWLGVHHRLVAYRAVAGVAFDPDAYDAAEPVRRDRLAASFARFLAVMHTELSSEEIAQFGIPAIDNAAQMARLQRLLHRVPSELRFAADDVVDHFREAWLEPPLPMRRVLLHNHFHVRTTSLTEPVGELAGVWDFSRLRVGPPSFDLRYFARVPIQAPKRVRDDLLLRIARQYARTGIGLDVDGARAAMAMEDLLDALVADDVVAMACALGDRNA